MKSAILALLCSYAAAFAPSSQQARSSALQANLADMPGATQPAGLWDPFNLANLGSDSTLAWFRAAELKHSRVAMLATTGYLVQASGCHFPGMLATGVSFESLSGMKPFDAWAAVPDAGQQQIIGAIFLTEIITESAGTHYTKGGDLPQIVFPVFNFDDVDADLLTARRSRELNNGRLAMVAIMSFVAATNVPGSVPFLAGNPMF